MCGICGVFETDLSAVIPESMLDRMANAIRHRGPDDQGIYTASQIGLAHRRLSIIDVEGGHQPLSNEDGTVWIAFNGEIYNFHELNKKYLSVGHRFRTRCDTETIAHLYEELGEQCFAELRGMFAIAIWDSRRRRLVLARDRVGKKPLFYSWNGRRLVFGSEIKALWPADGIPTDLDPEALADFFSYKYIPSPKTIYRSVRKVPPATYVIVDSSGLREVSYWDISFRSQLQLSEAEWCERLIDELDRSVDLRLVSDVPLGAFLSAGVDSSSVVALMNRHHPRVTTCSVGFTDKSYDETGDARDFADQIGANHHQEVADAGAIDVVPKLAWHYDEPFGDASAIPTYHVSRVARRYVTVSLSGDGGDENFGGYGRYRIMLREHRQRSSFPPWLRKRLFRPLGGAYPRLLWAPRPLRAKATLESLGRASLCDAYFHEISCCSAALKRQMLSGDVMRQLGGYESIDVMRSYFDRCAGLDPLSQLQYVDIKTYLTDDILTKVDRASMAHALEVRCPLLDHKLMELAAQMPAEKKIRNGAGKHIFKRAVRGLVPDRVIDRPKKGFAVPVAEWFRGAWREHAYEAVVEESNKDIFNRRFLARCWDEHQAQRRDWSALLWCVFMYRSWERIQQQ